MAAATTAVICRTKNRNLFLKRAIESVLAQTHEHFQLVIVNDGGEPAGVDATVAEYASHKNYTKIKVIHNPVSYGMEKASNVGIKASESDYVVIHDDDDSWLPEYLATTVGFLEAEDTPSRYAGVITKINELTETVTEHSIDIVASRILYPEKNYVRLGEMVRTNRFFPIAFLYRRSVFADIGYYNEELPVIGDWEFNLRFLTKYDIAVIDKPLANYHLRPVATGDKGNSVIAGKQKHLLHDSLIRNEQLRKETNLGLLLNVSLLLDDEYSRLNTRLDDLEGQLKMVIHQTRPQPPPPPPLYYLVTRTIYRATLKPILKKLGKR